jgi:glycosyltransferase involved in cell wall biosynthesis
MKLLHVVGSMNPRAGGPCQGIRNLATEMVKNGNSVEVVCLDDPRSDYLSKAFLPIHALGTGRGAWNYHPRLSPWFHQNLPRFDAIILNGLWQYPGYALLKATRQRLVPSYFIFPHGMLDPWFQHTSERRLKALRNWFYWKFVEQRVVGHAAALFFTCPEEMRLARGTFRPYRPTRELSVGYGVARPAQLNPAMTQAFASRCPEVGDKPFWLYLSRIHPKKSVDLLLKAYATVCRSPGHSLPPKLVVAGPGLETAYGQSMRRLASEICPPDTVFWPGMLAGDAKWGALYRCEASVLPSHQENFGISVVETLACGRPVLVSNQINIWHEIETDGAALVQPDSLEGTVRLLSGWLDLSPAARNAMADRARPCFQRHFSIEVVARQVETALKSTLHEQSRRRPQKDENRTR